MNNKIKTILLSLCFTGVITSCNFLDIDPVGSFDENTVFADPALAEVYVNAQYIQGRTGFGTSALRFSCDESYNNFNWNRVYVVNQGAMTPDDLGGIETWTPYYANIKDCNKFLEKVSGMKGDKKWIDRLTGEMTFLRAFYYMDLVNRYGGVPIITKTFGLNDDMMSVRRETYENSVKFVVAEFDKAAALLPLSYDDANFGRATKGAALAYKSRMLLYAASKLWNPTGDKAKWQAASDAALAVINLKNASGSPMYSLDSNYKQMFLNANSPEIIYARLYNLEFGNYHNGNNLPNGWGGYTATCVTQDMVDAYELEDGTMPTDALYDGVYDPNTNPILPGKYATNDNPWKGCDPRFYASIICDGQMLGKGGAMEGQVDFFINSDKKSGGSDSKFGNEGWNATKSGYAIRKFIKESAGWAWEKTDNPWIYSRLGEIYLNYAEAQFELGNEAVARTYINTIRERARDGKSGILPDVTESGEALRAKIHHERRVELAFEEHRFFDVRRWKIAETTEVKPARGMYISKDMATGKKTYLLINNLQRRDFKPQHYLLPVPQVERQKNPAIEQNPNYTK